MPDIEFVNRAQELDTICKPGAPRFILLDGAAGYGKTYMLHKIKDIYENERKKWNAALIDLKSDPQMRGENQDVAWACIANAIIERFEPHPARARTVPERSSEDMIIGILVPLLARQRCNILLLFDGVEVLSRSSSDWLKRLIGKLDQGLQRGHCQLRVVFAGRYASDWGKGATYPLRPISLSPFDREPVRDMVEQVAMKANINLTPEYLEDLAWWVLRISGGHPRGICRVLETVAAAGFVFVDLDFAFLKMPFQIGNQSGTLFELCIEPIIEELLQGVDDSLREVLAAISPVRRFDQELLDVFIDECIIDVPKYPSSWDLIRDLMKTRLITPPTDDPMFSDQIVRRMLAMQLQIKDLERFWEINLCAQQIFDKWANSNETKPDLRRVAVLESLYHTLQLESQENPPEEIQEKLKQRLDGYLTGIEEVASIYQLNYALNHDQELSDLIDRQVGGATVPALFDVIDRYLV